MFKCKACAAKDHTISLLESEITFLRALVHKPVDNSVLTHTEVEVNEVLDPHPVKVQSYANAVIAEADDIIAERDALLGATY